MAIVKLKPEANTNPDVTTPEMIEAPTKTQLTALVPDSNIKSLLKYVEGYPWTVNYYGQLVNENNTLNHFDPNLLDLTQSYYEIKKTILQVTSPISASYDSESGITKIDGAGLTPFGIKPNVGDLFIANIDTGEDAIFLVNNVERKTHRKQTLYEVSYQLYAYLSDEPGFLDSLNNRVHDTYYFNPDTNFYNRDVLIKPSVKEAMDRLSEFLRESKDYYFDTFIQGDSGSLCIPGVESIMYDPLLSRFISKTVDVSSIPGRGFYQHTLESKELDRPSILDNLLTRTLPHSKMSESKYGFCDAYSLPTNSRLGTLTYTGVEYVLFPINPSMDYTSPEPVSNSEGFLTDVRNENNYSESTVSISVTTNNDNTVSKKLLHTLFENDSYIVSDNFYAYVSTNSAFEEISYLELLIHKFLNREAIAKEDLAVAVQTYRDWSYLHQFYMLPVMWLLIKDGIGEN